MRPPTPAAANRLSGQPAASEGSARWCLRISGTVQGVGFRPFVYRLAMAHALSGLVRNTGEGVVVEVQGVVARLHEFVAALQKEAPPAALVDQLAVSSLPLQNETSFTIDHSCGGGTMSAGIPPDLAVCPDCLRELFASEDRRYRYPFLNCTNCGPRYTITRAIPYDRPQTSMCLFTMCAACQAEYDDPLNRRFHAQPNACPVCGPQLWLADREGRRQAEGEAAVARAIEQLKAGAVLAIKGVGGFHLAVDATNEEAVTALRQRKGREAKPLAVMARDLEVARTICHLAAAEEALLLSPARPIVLALRKAEHDLAPGVAPGSDRFGVMLPYAPLHHLLLADSLVVLVMTSANLSEEPICIDNAEALARLHDLADAFLLHNRNILIRTDDSVAWHQAGDTRLIRRSRGYAPRPLRLTGDGPAVLGVGGELKNTICYLKGAQAYLSQHIGDLKNLEAFQFFQESVAHLGRIYEVAPALVAYDLHPAYLTTQWAREQRDVPQLAVQHHHAHLAACLAENHYPGQAIGILLDGTGYGPDGTIWGGEVLVGDCNTFQRFARLSPLPLPGGDAAVAEPWRIGLAYLHAAYDGRVPELPFLAAHEPAPLLAMLARRFNSPLTSSCGRLFDAVAAISGGRPAIRYEAQAAIEFMQAAGGILAGPAFPFDLIEEDGMVTVALAPLIRAVAAVVLAGADFGGISRRFHLTLIELFWELARRAALATGLNTVALSGGVFQNHLLFAGLYERLQTEGFTVLAHRELPTNDGCIAFGQAIVGRQSLLAAG